MKKFSLSCLLLVFEIITLSFLAYVVNYSNETIVKLIITFVLFLFVFGHYKITSRLIWDEMKSLLKAMVCFFVACTVLIDEVMIFNLFWISFLMYVISIFFNRSLRIVLRKYLAKRTLVIGMGSDAARIGRISNNNRFALTRVVGYVRFKDEKISREIMERYEKCLHKDNEFRIYELLNTNMKEILEKEKIEQVILAIPQASKEEVTNIINTIKDMIPAIKYVPEIDVTMTFDSEVEDFDGILLISTSQGKINIIGRIIKRAIDVVAALCGIMLLMPIALYVRYKNRKYGDYDPIIFTQNRIGVDGKTIKIYKFRTMVPNAEKVLEELMENDPDIKREYMKNKKLVNDPRITKAGHMLRKSSLDEFPQFINVLKGEMSLVGPRPYLFREKADMGQYYDSIIHCKPGITGMWQANGRSDVGFEDRCKLDDYYYRNWNLGLDFVIVYKTFKGAFYGKGAL